MCVCVCVAWQCKKGSEKARKAGRQGVCVCAGKVLQVVQAGMAQCRQCRQQEENIYVCTGRQQVNTITKGQVAGKGR